MGSGQSLQSYCLRAVRIWTGRTEPGQVVVSAIRIHLSAPYVFGGDLAKPLDLDGDLAVRAPGVLTARADQDVLALLNLDGAAQARRLDVHVLVGAGEGDDGDDRLFARDDRRVRPVLVDVGGGERAEAGHRFITSLPSRPIARHLGHGSQSAISAGVQVQGCDSMYAFACSTASISSDTSASSPSVTLSVLPTQSASRRYSQT